MNKIATHGRQHAGLLIVLLYIACVESTELFGWRGSQLVYEFPILLLLYAMAYAPMRASRWRSFLAALPVLFFYLSHDLFYIAFGDVPQLADFSRVPDLLRVIGPAWGTALALLLALPFILILSQIDWRKLYRRPVLPLALVGVLAAVVASYMMYPASWHRALEASMPERISWGEYKNVRYYGRLSTALVRDAKRRSIEGELSVAQPIESTELYVDPAWFSRIAPLRNVHVVVLESFLDLQRLASLKTTRDPFVDAFRAMATQTSGVSVAPYYGTGTANSEFEVLCGVPSLGIISRVEFNAMTGSPMHCLPQILRQRGYRTLSMFPDSPKFYNAERAYRSMGFSESLFGDKYTPFAARSIRMDSGDGYTFDGTVYEQSLALVREAVSKQQPLFSYVLTMYGHAPFMLDTALHPVIVGVEPSDPLLERLVNQSYYRTLALQHYLTELQRIDPTSLVVLVSDHLPPLPGGPDQYQHLGFKPRYTESFHDGLHETFFLMRDRGTVVNLPPVVHFQIRDLILDRLAAGAFCRTHSCAKTSPHALRQQAESYTHAYLSLMREGSRT